MFRSNKKPVDLTEGGVGEFTIKFSAFLNLLESKNKLLKLIAEFEQSISGKQPRGINNVKNSLEIMRAELRNLLERMRAVSDEAAAGLRRKLSEIDNEINRSMPGSQTLEKDEFTIPFNLIGREHVYSVGSKNAQVGEMKSKLGLPTPEGFAITAWAYKRFMEHNDLPKLIKRMVESLDIKRHDQLQQTSDRLRKIILDSPVPDDLEAEIRASYDQLISRTHTRAVSMRSSGVWEDTHFSFAGQYASILNVSGERVVDQYRHVVAGQFTPQAIYYFLCHSLATSELAMSVGCVEMIDATASGVVYTIDPVDPDSNVGLISSIWGIGKYLVDGTLMPDVFRVSREDCEFVKSRIAEKTIQLKLDPAGGTIERKVDDNLQNEPTLTVDQICQLARYARKIEEHYGTPQDIEWSIDSAGNFYLLQTRPLRLAAHLKSTRPVKLPEQKPLLTGGLTVSPGAGYGKVVHVTHTGDLPAETGDIVVVAQNPFPGLITVMDRINALVTCTGSVASHMATIAREFRLPTMVGLQRAWSLEEGMEVTLDASGKAMYAGREEELVHARRIDDTDMADSPLHSLMKDLSAKICPLNLVDPEDEDFALANCQTYHDLVHYVHQLAIEELFNSVSEFDSRSISGIRLKTEIPVPLDIIFMNKELPKSVYKKGMVDESQVADTPLGAVWHGIREQGWPGKIKSSKLVKLRQKLPDHLSQHDRRNFARNSFCILSDEYMVLSLHLGFHFTTIECMCSNETSKNYVRYQHKGGGAALDRRVRREALIGEVLKSMGFRSHPAGDYLESKYSYIERDAALAKLFTIGRLMVLTKQLDMALSSDSLAEWYLKDIKEKLGLS